MPALMWFRSDLRTTDNLALLAACEHAPGSLTALFIATPGQWRRHDWGDNKIRFVARSVFALGGALASLGVPLRILSTSAFDGVPELILKAAIVANADTVFANHEVGVNEHARDRRVETLLKAHGIGFRAFHDDTLLTPGSVRTADDRSYTIFTPFKKSALRALAENPIRARKRPRPQGPPIAPYTALPMDAFGAAGPDALEALWPAGEGHAQSRLNAFARDGLNSYAKRRDLPALESTSSLSPHLAVGAISARQCLVAAIGANSGSLDTTGTGPTAWIGELLWREFFRHLFHAFPRLSKGRPFKPATERVPWRSDDASLDAWKQGRTGVPIVDAGMRQLRSIGWMHNRVRMITAMHLTKDLLIDWREGERHFMHHLIDADLAQNNSGWQWASSTGTDAAPYFRIFNPVTQSRRFDPTGAYIKRFVPELARLNEAEIHEPPPLTLGALGYPAPIVDHAMARARAIAAFKGLA